MGLLLLLAAICCFLLSWQGAKRLETVASGLDALAEGQTVQLPTEGFAGELAEKLNRTSAQLQARNELLARRDDARTQYICGQIDEAGLQAAFDQWNARGGTQVMEEVNALYAADKA